ncbi:MAG TPA: peptidoglycan DD-metalloendopeptidase family protein [Steroidobacteraceae bacterium]|nr:peptidoglycan DD-metalloendopeptidase family protein [Steroidobacteraceae bacterium]
MPARRAWWLAAAGFPLVAVALASLGNRPDGTSSKVVDLTPLVEAAPAAVTDDVLEPGPDSVEVTVQRNDTLDRIFRSAGIDAATIAELRNLPDARRALDLLRPGDIIRLEHIDGVLQRLNRQISATLTLSISRQDQGYAISYIENPLEKEVVGHRASIESSLFEAGKRAGISGAVIMTLANEIFGWDIDFALDIRRGDEFSVLYEQEFQDGEYVGDGRVLAAEFMNQGKRHRAVWFESADGEVHGYFTPEGESMRKAFLRAPLEFTRVSSVFNPKRRHPISGKVRAHKGIDYAARTGTPILAAGDGRVQFAGRKGGYGNAVILDHGRGITTLYAHMSRFSKAGRSGRRVKQGDVIGYVGSTGASTGPHLHYEYRVKGVHKNPATIPLPRTEIPSSYLAEFRAQAETKLAQLEMTSGERSEAFASR